MRNKEKKEIVITASLILVLLFIVIYDIKVKKPIQQVSALPQKALQSREVTAEKKNSGELFFKLEKESEELRLKRDPFSAASIRPVLFSPDDLELDGIAWDKEKPAAIINNEVLEIGDKINGKTVIDIREDRVILNDGTSNIELQLSK